MTVRSPKFIECSRHPNIEIITYAEVDRVTGEAGDFKVKVTKKPRYIIEDKCTGCNMCVDYCPVKIPDPFNQNLSESKAVHIYFSQAEPLVTYVDPETCLYLKEKKCQICVGVCGTKAIDLHQKPEEIELEVGAILLAPGYDTFDPKLRTDFGYGVMQNVVTSLEFERLLCSTGPFEGEVLRPSDKQHPHKIAWIQCVGSRQVIPGGNSYCSAVCCTYTQKQVILAKDHDSDLDATIFHNDIRAHGKDFERFYQRAEKLDDVRFIRSYVAVGREIPESQNVTVRYATVDDGVKEEEFDLVVLSVGLNPPKDVEKLASTFGIELNEHGFCKTDPRNPIRTTRAGVFVSGAFLGPVDIPEAVVAASGADAQIGELLNKRRDKLSRERVYPEERDTSEEELKIGVVVCHCGANIGRVVNIPELVEYASTLPNVSWAGENLFACSTENANQISRQIVEKGLNRLVLAACTPRTHEPLFRDTCREAGINQYFFEFANIREHCSWVHSKEKEKATEKAKDIVRMSVARAAHLQPLKEFDLPVDKTALVIGGGPAGMTTALSIAEQGFEVYLLEKESDLGGMAKNIHFTLEGMDVQQYLKELIKKVYKHPSVRVLTDCRIDAVSGYVGNFLTSVTAEGRVRAIKHGIVVIATGAREHRPTEYLYGTNAQIVTQLELEAEIVRQSARVQKSQNLVMIQCVGCREEGKNYCSRVCCGQAVKNALKLKAMNPDLEISILYRDMRTYGFKEDYYREAADKDIKFIRFEPENKPVVEGAGESLKVIVPDLVLGQKLELEADLVVLSAALNPSDSGPDMARFYKCSMNPDGFFQEAHVKLRPVDFGSEGVFLCGTAHYPKHLSESISQAYGAAGRAVTILSGDTVTASGSVCDVNEHDCVACGACITCCNYDAIEFVETPYGKKAKVKEVLCKGDGLCNAKCPTGAIYLKHYTDDEIFAQIDGAVREEVH